MDALTVDEVNALSHPDTIEQFEKLNFLRRVPEQKDSIRVFIAIPPPRAPSLALLDRLTDDICDMLRLRTSQGETREGQLLHSAIFYSGVGTHVAYLIEGVVLPTDYPNITAFNKKISQLSLQRFGLKTTTYLTTLPASERASSPAVPPWSAFLSERKTARDYLTSPESEVLEYKGSTIFDVGRYIATKVKVRNEALTREVLSTVVGFLNSNGGELVIGAVEDRRFHGPLHEKLSEAFPDPPIGDMRVVGVEWDYIKDNTWDTYQGHLRSLISDRIGGSYANFIYIDKLPVVLELGDASLCVIRVMPLPMSEVAYLDNEDCYVRSGASTRSLRGRDLQAFVSRRR